MVHGVTRADELAYRDRLEAWQRGDSSITYLPAVSRPDDPANRGWTGLTGRLDAALPEIMSRAALHPTDTVAYLCGNPAMIAAVTSALRRRGLPPDAIVSEQYWPDPGAA